MAFSLKDYTYIEKIGEGGQGKVYRAVQTSLKRKVVIKEMAIGTVEPKEQLTWLEEEAAAAASLEHDNIVRIYDFGYDHGRFYLVMEYVEGFDLSRLMLLKKFPRGSASWSCSWRSRACTTRTGRASSTATSNRTTFWSRRADG